MMKANTPTRAKQETGASLAPPRAAVSDTDFLKALGERIRLLRARRGISRKMLADAADVSLRYLSDLETGAGNASVLLLRQVARALDVPIEEIVNESGERSPEFLLLVQALRGLSDERLTAAKKALDTIVTPVLDATRRIEKLALIGLRGAGKSTIGKLLAERLGTPFVELNKAIEASAGLDVGEIHSLYGQSAYRRYERRCLERVAAGKLPTVLATPGSIVAEVATFNYLLTHFYTIWLRAEPDAHMARVIAQGDMRPITGHREAMDDLKRILEGRVPFYSKADLVVDTTGAEPAETVAAIIKALRQAVAAAA